MNLFIQFPAGVRGQTTIGASVVLDPQDVTILVHQTKEVLVRFRGRLTQAAQFNFTLAHERFVKVSPSIIPIDAPPDGFIDKAVPVLLEALSPGQFDLDGKIFPTGLIDDVKAFIRITIANSDTIIYVAIVIGWIYFVAWTVSFWPQMIINFRRKSVVGLSFDFLTLNMLGHTLYAIFNCSLYWNDRIEQEYFNRNPHGLNPVIANDVAFSLHASLATFLTVVQCFIYEVRFRRFCFGQIQIFNGLFFIERGATSIVCCPRHSRNLWGRYRRCWSPGWYKHLALVGFLVCAELHQASDYSHQVRTTSSVELQAEEYSGLEYRKHPARLHGRCSQHATNVAQCVQLR